MTNQMNMRVRAAGMIIEDDFVLLVEYYSEQWGLQYVLPGGAVQARETIREALERELLEETCLQVEVGPLLLAYEYAPHLDPIPRNIPPAVTLLFACRTRGGKARMPDCPDRDQTGVRWVPLDELDSIRLTPPIQKTILDYAYNEKPPLGWIEEWRL